ncbi:MAG: cadherin domain-containing protein [Luteolibacter sp.]
MAKKHRATPTGSHGQIIAQTRNHPEIASSRGTHATGLPVTREFVRTLATGPARISFPLPDGRRAAGTIEQNHISADGSPAGVTGRLDAPGNGTFHFRLQPDGATTGPVVGAVVIDDVEIAFRVQPGPGNTSVLAALPVDQVICRRYAPPPEIASQPQEIPADHPTDIPYPSYQNGVIPLHSRPGAISVIYLDFDGEPGPHEGWRDSANDDFNAAPPEGMTPAIVKSIWTGVAEDFAPFHLNVTTDLQVYLNAPETSRQRCIITPTTAARPGAGGVAYLGSFAWSGDTPCWCFFYSNAKNAIEIISHEIGHTLGLSHDGQLFANGDSAEYYWGHGPFATGWAPIMGVGYNRNLTQWSQGEYPQANQAEDDIAIIASNPSVGLVDDDAGDDHQGAVMLEVDANGSVDSQGCISTQTDVDAFRFTTAGGSLSLTVSAASFAANLDVSATLHGANGAVIAQASPDSSLNATLSATLAAGEYTIRVNGASKGNPLDTGYTDYGSLGFYEISGTIVGVVGPDRFTLAENAPLGTKVGSLQPRLDHGNSSLTYAISSGNSDSAFAIDPATGEITVANPSAINFEALSSGWDRPSSFDLTVTISDSMTPALDESLRVVVTIMNVNEPPHLSGERSIIAVSHTVLGVTLGNLSISDPDRFDFATAQIVSGDPTGKFSLSPSGSLSLTGSLDASIKSSYPLTIRTTDQGFPALTTDEIVTVTVIPTLPALTPGFAYQTIYADIPGSAVANLTSDASFPTSPTSEEELADFSTTSLGDTYGSTVRAWLIAPVTGTYRFWISGDDRAELFLDPDGIPANTAPICRVNSPTRQNAWTESGSQESGSFNLIAGQVCSIEARHKQQSHENHLSVAWEIKDPADTVITSPRQVIPGRYLSPRFINYSPKIFAQSASLYRNSYVGSQVAISFASDRNPTDTLTWAISGGNESGAFQIDATTGEVTVASPAALTTLTNTTVVLTLTVTDDGPGPLSDSGPLMVHLLDPAILPTSGLVQEFWDEIPGSALADLYMSSRYPDRPDRVTLLGSFEMETTSADDFGTRIRAFFIPPSNGSYTFAITGQNAGSFFLSSDSTPQNAFEIASAGSSQASLPVPLAAGQRYFIEARMKHAAVEGSLAVTWAHQNSPGGQIIGDEVTTPYDSNVSPSFTEPSYHFDLSEFPSPGAAAGVVTASDSPFEAIRYAIVSGDPLQAFGIHPKTGMIRVVNPSNLVIGSIYQLQVGAQDSGHGGNFAPRETLVPVTISLPNSPPEFVTDPVVLGHFPANEPMAVSLTNFVSDPEDPVVLSLFGGPSWLSLSSGGVLSGNPSYPHFGPHSLTVLATDGRGNTTQGIFNLVVSSPASVPASILTTVHSTPAAITGNHDSQTMAGSSVSDSLYEALHEASSSGTSALDFTWTFPTPPSRPALLEIEAHHSVNNENDDFQFSVSTDGGATFSDVILISSNSDDDTVLPFAFTTGVGGSTIVKVIDTDRIPGNSSEDTLLIDLLRVTLVGNTLPAMSDASYQISNAAPYGVTIGNATASDPDPAQTLTYTIPRGNSAGRFAVSASGTLQIAGTIPAESGPYSLIVMAGDNGTPPLANYATITIEVVAPIPASIMLGDLTPVYDQFPKSVAVTTDPPNLSTVVFYDGSPTLPTAAGNYTVSVSIVDPLHIGSTTDTLSIGKAPANVILTDLSQPYDGFTKSAAVVTDPPGLSHTLTYGQSAGAPTDVGSYAVTATITDPNHVGSSTGTFVITHLLAISNGQSFVVPQTNIPYQSLLNHGTLVIAAHPLHVSGNATNHGVLRLYGDAIIDISGTFTNSGVIDTINWNGTLPSGLINTGTILDRTSLRVLSSGVGTGHQFNLSIPGFPGHFYQLESSNLSDAWSPLGQLVPGAGNAVNPPTLHFTPDLDGAARFYRVVVTPAP